MEDFPEEETSRAAKVLLGVRAAAMVRAGMRLGIGSGTTVSAFIDALGRRIRDEGLVIEAAAASLDSADHARAVGVSIRSLDDLGGLDLAVDGADAVGPGPVLIKGGGAALVRERLQIAASAHVVILVDSEKPIGPLHDVTVPVAVLPYGWTLTRTRLAAAVDTAQLRESNGHPVITDDGLYIVDVAVRILDSPKVVHEGWRRLEGVVDTGIFVGYALEIWASDGKTCWCLSDL